MANHPIIIGEGDDPHVAAILVALDDRGVTRPLVLNAELLSRSDYLYRDASLLLAGVETPLTAPRQGWLRRFVPDSWRGELGGDSLMATERAAWMELLMAVVLGAEVEWLTTFANLDRAENKAVQYEVAARAGAPVPRWVVTSNVQSIDVQDDWVAKPLGPAEYATDEGGLRLIFTRPLPHDRDWEGWSLLRGAPFILQQRLNARAHLRVVTVEKRAWTCVMRRTAELDWRRDHEAHTSFEEPGSDFDVSDMEAMALRVARAHGAGFSSQDWIWDGERSWFVDLNPAGQWLFLPEPQAQGITSAIAEYLSRD